jgi:hypothetical protein
MKKAASPKGDQMISKFIVSVALTASACGLAYAQTKAAPAESPLGKTIEYMRGLIKNPKLAGTSAVVCDSTRERCVIPIYAGTAADGSCTARMDLGIVIVPQPTGALAAKKKKIRVVWEIFPTDVGDANKYRFHPTLGINFQQGSGIQTNDVTQDFADPGEDNQDSGTFRWVSVNARPGRPIYFQYLPTVQVYNRPTDSWQNCFAGDPTISNYN